MNPSRHSGRKKTQTLPGLANGDASVHSGPHMVSTCPFTFSDAPPSETFLHALFVSTSPLGPLVASGDTSLLPLLWAQARAQRVEWAATFGEAGHRDVRREGVPIGRLWTADLGEDEVRLVDVTLLPEVRGAGLGGSLLRHVLDTAHARGRTVVLHVDPSNPALRLYRRLGFVAESNTATHLRMRSAHTRP
jgi:GNAT superfamily N-acetyltransferase